MKHLIIAMLGLGVAGFAPLALADKKEEVKSTTYVATMTGVV